MRRLAFLAFALACLAPAATRAQPIDLSSGGPVEVTARGGFEWRQNEQVVIATGDARAVRENVTVLADRLIAYYRKKGSAPGTSGGLATPAPPPPSMRQDTAAGGQSGGSESGAGVPDSGSNEVYRLEAEGNVRIFTQTDLAVGDRAIYDIDQAVLVMTGAHMKLTTPQQVMTARDSMEYWSQKHMAVGRGDAVVVTSDGRRLAGDVLVGFTNPNSGQPSQGATTTKAVATTTPNQGQDPLLSSGKLERVEAYGNVEARTQVDIVRGDRGVYVPDTGIARILGHVRITHGQNQLNGPAADVNMKTGIAHLIATPGLPVKGLIMPNDTNSAAAGTQPQTGKAGAPK
jgi:lipopolysaccharide export system protein LptA